MPVEGQYDFTRKKWRRDNGEEMFFSNWAENEPDYQDTIIIGICLRNSKKIFNIFFHIKKKQFEFNKQE